MKKKCAICKKIIDLSEEGVTIASKNYQSMNYCMCGQCGNVNVECSSNAALIALDQVISEPIQKDAEESISDFLQDKMDFDMSVVMDFIVDGINKIKEEKRNREPKETIKEDVTKNSTDNKIDNNSNIKDQRDVGYIVYNRGKVVKEYPKNANITKIFEELADIYGMPAIATERVTVHEVNQVKPKIKEKVTYEFEL